MASRVTSPATAGTCRACGTETPARETLCATCARRALAEPGSALRTLAHWALFLAAMALILGAGVLLAP